MNGSNIKNHEVEVGIEVQANMGIDAKVKLNGSLEIASFSPIGKKLIQNRLSFFRI